MIGVGPFAALGFQVLGLILRDDEGLAVVSGTSMDLSVSDQCRVAWVYLDFIFKAKQYRKKFVPP
jgi:hypothetical protein